MLEKIRLALVIDPHVHARDMEQANMMTVMQTFIEAKRSGVGVVCLMSNTNPSIDNPGALHRYLKLIEEAEEKTGVIGYVWIALTDTNHKSVIYMLKHPKVIGVKIYPLKDDGSSVTTGAVGIQKWESIEKLLLEMRKEGIYKPIAGHWEDPKLGHTVESEVSALKNLVNLANDYADFKFTACHLTSAEGLKVIADAQRHLELDIMIEITPHHLWFTNDVVDVTKGIYKCFPPIKSTIDRTALRNFLKESINNPLVSIGSDTAPHPIEAKMSGNPPGGLATLQHIVPVMLSLQDELGLTDRDIENLTSNNIAHFLNINITQKYSIWEKNFWGPDSVTYNNGNVINPFKGEKLKGRMIKGD